ncbi:MAG: tetratricopeptide repeat protein [Rhizobacter sp.]
MEKAGGVPRDIHYTRRRVILLAVLLCGLAVLAWPLARSWVWQLQHRPQPPLPGQNSISGLHVRQGENGRWLASFDYFYTGDRSNAALTVQVSREGAASPATLYKPAERGAHHVDADLPYPGDGRRGTTTTDVTANLVTDVNQVVVKQTIEHRIQWPDMYTWVRMQQTAKKSNTELIDEAVALIDHGDRQSVDEAKALLDRVVARDPKAGAAYVELARVAMKSNWGAEGLHQAESLLKSALQIQPDSANAKILLGYVQAHQGRYASAEALFADVASGPTGNLWLWANWGEVLMMQGKVEPAIAKYREAVSRPRSQATYDRARLDAFERLLALLEQRHDVDAMEALHRQRADEFGPGSCFTADYAIFVLQQRGDSARAITLARQAMEGSCRDGKAREALGAAYYAAWAAAPAAQRDEMLNLARVNLPPGARTLYRLAGSDKTVAAAKRLIASGEAIDQLDNERFPALAYALRSRDHAAARRLLALGAATDALVGAEQMPVALLPVVMADVDGIRLMRKAGVDYTKLRYQGSTALDHARAIGDRRLLEALDASGQKL